MISPGLSRSACDVGIRTASANRTERRARLKVEGHYMSGHSYSILGQYIGFFCVTILFGNEQRMHVKRRQSEVPNVQIVLDDRRTYTTSERLEGVLSITTTIDTAFGDIDVEFSGTCRTSVPHVTVTGANAGRLKASHRFLRLKLDLKQHYPPDRCLRAYHKYDFRIVFVVPLQLLPNACQHGVVTPVLHHAHTQLPPSLGCEDIFGKAKSTQDIGCIRYILSAKMSKTHQQGNGLSRMIIAEKHKELHIMPTSHEQPPLDVSEGSSEYVMRKEITIRSTLR